MKSARQAAIHEIIDTMPIQTQDELADELVKRGFYVTQATISRDIKDLRLVKIIGDDGIQKYATSEKEEQGIAQRFHRMFTESVLSIRTAGTLIVIKTISGTANSAALVIDSMKLPEILGCIAGDDTIFVAVTSEDKASQCVARFLKMLRS
ncbi:MAG: arginine repressor [Eubacteriales bacterium]|nr:arginine repressor [Eubacteriales bacterium]